MTRYTISSTNGWLKTLSAATLADALFATYDDRAATFRITGSDTAWTVYEGRRTVATVIKEDDLPELVCSYCGGELEYRAGEGHYHATAAERINPATIGPGDFVSARHNQISRVNPADVMTRKEYDSE